MSGQPNESQTDAAHASDPTTEASRIAWSLNLPTVIGLNIGFPRKCDQRVSQVTSKNSVASTIWEWAEPLLVCAITKTQPIRVEPPPVDDLLAPSPPQDSASVDAEQRQAPLVPEGGQSTPSTSQGVQTPVFGSHSHGYVLRSGMAGLDLGAKQAAGKKKKALDAGNKTQSVESAAELVNVSVPDSHSASASADAAAHVAEAGVSPPPAVPQPLHVFLRHIPVRMVEIQSNITSDHTPLAVTGRYTTIAAQMARPIGDFQASRFFSLPGAVDTRALTILVEAIQTCLSGQRDDAALLSCLLLSELVATGEQIAMVSRISTVTAWDLYAGQVTRHVGLYSHLAANGHVAAVDLTYFSLLLGMVERIPNPELQAIFGRASWDVQTAVVPVWREQTGRPALIPYMMSFLASSYWMGRVGYDVEGHDLGGFTSGCTIHTVPCAAQVSIPGPANVLFVVLDVDIRQGGNQVLNVGGRAVPIWGKSGCGCPRVGPPTIRVQEVFDSWFGRPGFVGDPPGKQQDAYLAWEQLNRTIGMSNSAEIAVTLATELSRTMPLHCLVSDYNNSESCGGFEWTRRSHMQDRFDDEGPKLRHWPKRLATPMGGSMLAWLGWYNIAPSGMLHEAGMEVEDNAFLIPGLLQLGDIGGYEGSVPCASACVEVRMGRALELIGGATVGVVPRKNGTLTPWLSANAVLLASATTTAYLSKGLTWASVNGLMNVSSDFQQHIEQYVPLVCAHRVSNSVAVKRQLYLGGDLDYETLTEAISTDRVPRRLDQVPGFPIPFFVVKGLAEKFGIMVSCPSFKQQVWDQDPDDDVGLGQVIAPTIDNWTFAPWISSTIDWSRERFSVFTNTPYGRSEREQELSVFPAELADAVSASRDRGRNIGLPDKVKLTTDSLSSAHLPAMYKDRRVFTYVDRYAPAGLDGGEPRIKITIPDPAVDVIKSAWQYTRGWVPAFLRRALPIGVGSLDPSRQMMSGAVTGWRDGAAASDAADRAAKNGPSQGPQMGKQRDGEVNVPTVVSPQVDELPGGAPPSR